jgi:ankyrin repeat protein
MKIKSPAILFIILVVTCGVVASGCRSAHPHSAYRKIHQDAINGDAAGVAADLAEHPDDLNLPEDDGLTPLHLAAENCHADVVMQLLDKGAKINVAAKDNTTPLHLAAQEGCTNVVAVLLEHGANVHAKDNKNRTPLMRAEQWQQGDTAQQLKLHGGTE